MKDLQISKIQLRKITKITKITKAMFFSRRSMVVPRRRERSLIVLKIKQKTKYYTKGNRTNSFMLMPML